MLTVLNIHCIYTITSLNCQLQIICYISQLQGSHKEFLLRAKKELDHKLFGQLMLSPATAPARSVISPFSFKTPVLSTEKQVIPPSPGTQIRS